MSYTTIDCNISQKLILSAVDNIDKDKIGYECDKGWPEIGNVIRDRKREGGRESDREGGQLLHVASCKYSTSQEIRILTSVL